VSSIVVARVGIRDGGEEKPQNLRLSAGPSPNLGFRGNLEIEDFLMHYFVPFKPLTEIKTHEKCIMWSAESVEIDLMNKSPLICNM